MLPRPPRFICICSGISAPTVALKPMGFEPLAYAEIDPAAAAILSERHGAGRPLFMPDPELTLDPSERRARENAIKALSRIEWADRVPNYGDFTRLRDDPIIADADMTIGGTPCQDFSIAGLRASLGGDRGNLTMEFIRLANATDDLRQSMGRPPAFHLWENVLGALTTKDNALGTFLGGMVGFDRPIEPPKGGSWPRAGVVHGPDRVAAWRVLDTQHFGLPQRRRRVFVLSRRHPRGWAVADALLPIIESMCGHPPPREGAREGASSHAEGGAGNASVPGDGGRGGGRPVSVGDGSDGASRPHGGGRPGGRGRNPGRVVPGGAPEITGTVSAKWAKGTGGPSGDEAYNLIAVESDHEAVAFSMRGRDGENMAEAEADPVSPTIRTGGGDSSKPFVAQKGSHLKAFPIARDALRGDSVAKTATPDAAGLVRKRNAGIGIGDEGDPAFTLTASGAPVVALASDEPRAFNLSPGSGSTGAPSAVETDIAATITATGEADKNGRGTHVLHGVALSENQRGELRTSDIAMSMSTGGGKPGQGMPVAFTVSQQSNGFAWENDTAPTLMARQESPTSSQFSGVRIGVMVRRLTPLECEKLMGFPEHFTLIPYGSAARTPEDLEETYQYLLAWGFGENEARALADVPDGHRYRVLGNSMGVHVIRHIGRGVLRELEKEAALGLF